MSEAALCSGFDEALKSKFSTAAKAHDRTGTQLLRDFMRHYVRQQLQAAEYNAWLRAKVERSRASANDGNSAGR